MESLGGVSDDRRRSGRFSEPASTPTSYPHPPLRLFLRCGDRFSAPDGNWRVLTLPYPLEPSHLPGAVRDVRVALKGARDAHIVIAGPVVLGVALGQGLAHLPVRIRYLQLNQKTKQFEVWCVNTVDW